MVLEFYCIYSELDYNQHDILSFFISMRLYIDNWGESKKPLLLRRFTVGLYVEIKKEINA